MIAPKGAVVLLVAMTAETKELIARKRRMLNEGVVTDAQYHRRN